MNKLNDIADYEEISFDDLSDRNILYESINIINAATNFSTLIGNSTHDSIWRLSSRKNQIVKWTNIKHIIDDYICGRWYEIEPLIMINLKHATLYAIDVIKRRWKEAEPIIMGDPEYIYYYVKNILKRRWREAEPIIMRDKYWWSKYSAWLIQNIRLSRMRRRYY